MLKKNVSKLHTMFEKWKQLVKFDFFIILYEKIVLFISSDWLTFLCLILGYIFFSISHFSDLCFELSFFLELKSRLWICSPREYHPRMTFAHWWTRINRNGNNRMATRSERTCLTWERTRLCRYRSLSWALCVMFYPIRRCTVWRICSELETILCALSGPVCFWPALFAPSTSPICPQLASSTMRSRLAFSQLTRVPLPFRKINIS